MGLCSGMGQAATATPAFCLCCSASHPAPANAPGKAADEAPSSGRPGKSYWLQPGPVQAVVGIRRNELKDGNNLFFAKVEIHT